MAAQEDKEQFCNAVRSEVKSAGLMDTPENLWDFFIEKVRCQSGSSSLHMHRCHAHGWLMSCCAQVRKYLHVVLCFSPVGDRFRIRARQFPALVNCTSFDWFHTWPSEVFPCSSRCLPQACAGPACEVDERRPW